VGNDVNTLHEEKNLQVGFSFIRVYNIDNGQELGEEETWLAGL
jgi:hypothetical protein